MLCNATASEMIERAKPIVVGKRYSEIFEDGFFGFSMSEMLKEKRASLRLFLKQESKLQKPLELLVSPIGGKKGGVFILLKKEASQKSEALCERGKLSGFGDVMASLVHEIRNPLTAIDGFATLLAFELKEKEARQKARSILEGTELIERLINDALDFCSTPKIKSSSCQLEELVKEVICHFEVASQEKERVKLAIKGEARQLSVDSELLKLALFNLLKNGLEASSEHSLIHVEIRYGDGGAEIAVRDSGRGLESAELEKLFTPRFTTKSSGHGLGLAETYRAIQVQGGTLSVESKVGQGSTFTIKLKGDNGP